MLIELELKRMSGNVVFHIPASLTDPRISSALKEGRALVVGNKYRLTIEEVK